MPLVIGTYYWDHDTLLRTLVLALCGAIYAAAVVLAGVEAVRALRDRRGTRRAWGVWILLLTLGATYLALYGSTFNLLGRCREAATSCPRTSRSSCSWAAIVRLSRRSRVLAGAVLALVLAFHLWTNSIYLWPLRPEERARRGAEIAARAALGERLQARPAEALLVDDPMESLRWQFLLGRPRISALLSEVYYPSAAPTDAAERVADPRVQAAARGFPPQPRDARRTATATRFGEEWLYEDVRVAGPGLPARLARGLAVARRGGTPRRCRGR